MISDKPVILHISCHGIVNVKKIHLGGDFEEARENGNYLLFETYEGKGELISAKQIRKLLEKSQQKLDVVIIAACDSEYIGKVFLKNGAKHVICVKQERFMLDDAASKFASRFYSNVFQGQDICEAFEEAKSNVVLQLGDGEANLFTMLHAEIIKNDAITYDNPRAKKVKHQCYHIKRVAQGQFECKSDHNLAKKIPYKDKKFKYREKEMFTSLDHLLIKNDRIVQINGLRGIGKSSLAKNLQNFLSDRKICTDGNIYIDCKTSKDIY